MGERRSYAPGTFCWQELASTDSDAAKDFYGGVFGWEPDDQPLPGGGSYTVLRLGERRVAGLYEQSPEQRAAEIAPSWASYVSVTDVDGAVARAASLGADVVAQPFAVMEAGRMAVLRDPVGAMVSLWEPGKHAGAELVNEPGTFCWNELGCADPERASKFYSALFGWRVDLDAVTGYRTLSNGTALGGGIRPLSEAETGTPPGWMAYLAVDAVDTALGAASDAGGHILAPATDIDIGRFAVVTDPQGAVFAVFEGETNP